MRVLSLYDGMSCGMLAFMRAGIPVESYDAYEIDKHAIKVSQHNFPQIVQHGDVFKGDFTSYKGKVDAIVGGSPCFVAGTMVLTSEGMRPIEQVRVGDLVYTHSHRFRPVTAVGHKTAQVFRMVSDGVPDILVTDNHPFYVSRMTRDRYGARQFSGPHWKAAGELIPDSDFLSSPIVMGSYNPRGLTIGHCRLLARMLASRRIPDGYREWMAEVSEENHLDTADGAPVMALVSENSLPLDPDNREIPVEILQLPQKLAHAFMGEFLECAGKRDEANGVWTYKARNPAMAHSFALLAQKVYETPGIIVRDTVYRGCDDGSVTPVPVWIVTVGYGTDRMVSGRRIFNDLYTPFRSLEPRGEDTVYNLSVEQDESYLAGNRIVHNCTYWSIAQSKHRETEAHGIGWELFQQYVRAVREAEPRFFVYENNKSMAKTIREEISNTFGFEPICINSALVSAQNRQRLYWVGVRNDDGTYRKASIEQPEDRGILLKDVLDGNFRRNLSEKEVEYMVRPTADGRNHFDYGHHTDVSKDKSPCITACLSKGVPYNVLVEPVRVGLMPRSDGEVFDRQGTRIYDPEGKSITLSGDGGGAKEKTGLYAIPATDGYDGHHASGGSAVIGPIPLNITRDGKSQCIRATCYKDGIRNLVANDVERRTCVAHEVIGSSEDGSEPKGFSMTGTFGERRASVNDKAYCLAANPSSDMDARVIVPVGCDYVGAVRPDIIPPAQTYPVRDNCDVQITDRAIRSVQRDAKRSSCAESFCFFGDTKIHALTTAHVPMTIQGTDGAQTPIYTVENGHITINGRTYPIKLKDGRYIIRKLSVDECKRLQTVPEWYDMSCISKSQAYKCLGNGWTIEVIAHLIQGAVRELDPDFVPTEVGAEPTAKMVTLDSFTEVSP